MAINKALISSTMVALTLASFAGTGVVSAQAAAPSVTVHPHKTTNAFARHNEEAVEARHLAMKNRLDQAVKDGKLTADQESKLLSKLQTLESNLESLRDESESKRKDDRNKLISDFESWLKANNIPQGIVQHARTLAHRR